MNRFRPIFQNISVQIQHLCIYTIIFYTVESLVPLSPPFPLPLPLPRSLALCLRHRLCLCLCRCFCLCHFCILTCLFCRTFYCFGGVIFVSVTLIAYARECSISCLYVYACFFLQILRPHSPPNVPFWAYKLHVANIVEWDVREPLLHCLNSFL